MLKPGSFYSATLVAIICILTVSCSKNNSANSTAEKQAYNSTGVIRGIDTNTNEVTIDHKDIPGLMSPMVMDFAAAEKSVFDGFAIGDTVEFVLERVQGKIVLVSMKKVAQPAAAVSGEQLFAANCAECHGPKGEGAKKGIPLISGHALGHAEEEHLAQVEFGKKDKMPAFRDKLTPEQIREVVRFVRETLQKEARKDDKVKHDH